MWIKAATAFAGGTAAAQKLKGKTVKVSSNVSLFSFNGLNPQGRQLGPPVQLTLGETGLIVNAMDAQIIMGFAKPKASRAATEANILRHTHDFNIVSADWNDFKRAFEIDM